MRCNYPCLSMSRDELLELAAENHGCCPCLPAQLAHCPSVTVTA